MCDLGVNCIISKVDVIVTELWWKNAYRVVCSCCSRCWVAVLRGQHKTWKSCEPFRSNLDKDNSICVIFNSTLWFEQISNRFFQVKSLQVYYDCILRFLIIDSSSACSFHIQHLALSSRRDGDKSWVFVFFNFYLSSRSAEIWVNIGPWFEPFTFTL